MQTIGTIAMSFMSSYFLVYLTDYAGLGSLGATIAPSILAIGRIVDAVNDPLQGWIIDAAPRMKFGKYRFFILLSILITSVSICGLYSIPGPIKTNVALLYVWILFFYLLYDMGVGFNANFALIQTTGANDIRRSKLMLYNRLLAVFIGAVFSALLAIVNALNSRIHDFGKSFSVTTILFIAIGFAISLPCLLMVKQGDSDTQEKKEEKARFKDVLTIFKLNKAFIVHFIGVLIRNFVFTFMTATTAYYTKWAYCADMETGQVNNALLGRISMISAVVMMVPMLLSAILSPMILKKLGLNVKVLNFANWITLFTGILTFILQMLGILQLNYGIFAMLMGIMAFGNGLCFVPTQTMWMECIDYNEKVSGKPMGGTISALSGFIGKVQTAVSTLLVGWILSLIGYEVDSATGDYLGQLSGIPAMLNWFIIVCALLPAICSIASVFIYRKYPLASEQNTIKDTSQGAQV